LVHHADSDRVPAEMGSFQSTSWTQPRLIVKVGAAASAIYGERNVRKAEWDLIRGNHQGQRQLRCIKQAGHKTAPDLMSKLQKILAMQEPSTQDIEGQTRDCAGF
jgi:hypothetical protein